MSRSPVFMLLLVGAIVLGGTSLWLGSSVSDGEAKLATAVAAKSNAIATIEELRGRLAAVEKAAAAAGKSATERLGETAAELATTMQRLAGVTQAHDAARARADGLANDLATAKLAFEQSQRTTVDLQSAASASKARSAALTSRLRAAEARLESAVQANKSADARAASERKLREIAEQALAVARKGK